MQKVDTKLTEPEIMGAYKAAERIETDAQFARELMVSRQRMGQWLVGTHAPDKDWLQLTALVFNGKWQSQMAVDLLKHRGLEDDVPCICLEVIGDNGHCPKHEAGLEKVES